MDAPDGLIDADRLVELVRAMRNLATGIARVELDSPHRGRPSIEQQRLARIHIGIYPGSTTLVAERATPSGAFDLGSEDEVNFDRKFSEAFEGLGTNTYPEWMPESLAETVNALAKAIHRTAPTVTFKRNGENLIEIDSAQLLRGARTKTPDPVSEDEVMFIGKLFAVNLRSHRLQVEDDVGNQVSLPDVDQDIQIAPLINSYVMAVGTPEHDSNGYLTKIHNATVEPAPDPFFSQGPVSSRPLQETMMAALGPTPGGLAGITDEEYSAYLEALADA